MNSSHIKRRCIEKTAIFVAAATENVLIIELLMWLLVNSWLNYLERIYSSEDVLWTKEQKKTHKKEY